MRGVSLHGTFLVDPDAVPQAYELHANNIGRTEPEMLRKLKAAGFARAHDGQVCQASWRPGGETLRPGHDLVGQPLAGNSSRSVLWRYDKYAHMTPLSDQDRAGSRRRFTHFAFNRIPRL
jgi:hypothetical protein